MFLVPYLSKPLNVCFRQDGNAEFHNQCLSLQSALGVCCRQDLSKAKLVIEDLFVKTNEIRRKAEQSEVMVQEICRDIKKLDYAKQHLTQTITALRRLAMLVTAVGKSWMHVAAWELIDAEYST